jgi:hypothetical protein
VRFIRAEIQIKTNIPADKPRYDVVEYRVARRFGLCHLGVIQVQPETVLWANYDVLQDDPHSLAPGQVLKIPPTDGIYYQWKENDTLEVVPLNSRTTIDEILNLPRQRYRSGQPEIESGSVGDAARRRARVRAMARAYRGKRRLGHIGTSQNYARAGGGRRRIRMAGG